MMSRHIITDKEIEKIINASGAVMRCAYGDNVNMEKAASKLDRQRKKRMKYK